MASPPGGLPLGRAMAVGREAPPCRRQARGLGPSGFGTRCGISGTGPTSLFPVSLKIPAKESYGGTSFLQRLPPRTTPFST